jgi:hypothetical protein
MSSLMPPDAAVPSLIFSPRSIRNSSPGKRTTSALLARFWGWALLLLVGVLVSALWTDTTKFEIAGIESSSSRSKTKTYRIGGGGAQHVRNQDNDDDGDLEELTDESFGDDSSSFVTTGNDDVVSTNQENTTAGGVESSQSASSSTAVSVQSLDPDQDPPGYKKPHRVYSDSYVPRGKAMNDTLRQELAQKWGSWTMTVLENDNTKRPTDDYYAQYPNRDVPYSKFPPNAWQTDPEYLSQFLPQALALVRRSMEAILTEYGHGRDDEPTRSFEERSQGFRFMLTDNVNDFSQSSNVGGGKTTPSSFNGLVRRLLHAVWTEDHFVVVMGGHSAAAGHGNHFEQSYTLQIQKILEPILARLGVTMTAHNIANGGMGTSQSCLGARDLYGDVDVILYDSG